MTACSDHVCRKESCWEQLVSHQSKLVISPLGCMPVYEVLRKKDVKGSGSCPDRSAVTRGTMNQLTRLEISISAVNCITVYSLQRLHNQIVNSYA